MSSDGKHRKHWVGCQLEADYFGEDRKVGKADRKTAMAKDRSKYKKTDQKKEPKTQKISYDNLLKGRVISIESQGVTVAIEGEGTLNCSLKGVLKKENTQSKNLVAVGDVVWVEKSNEGEGQIAVVEERKTVLSRADNLSRRKEQIIASNVDQVLITSSVVSPPIKFPLIDRYIIAADKGGMTPIVVINKVDLLGGPSDDPLVVQERAIYADLVEAYKKANITLIGTSIETGEGIDLLKNIMKDKVSVFSGQSGVGKSSLINAVAGYDLRIGDVVDRTKKGAHTTTSTKLLPLSFGGWCVDTPGIKSFGVWQLDKDEVEHYFDEIFSCGHNCKYPDCSHTGEDGCAVTIALDKGEISSLRYSSYCALLESLQDPHHRR